jgi:hypothetical protein
VAILRYNFLHPTYLARELEKLQVESAQLRCAFSRRFSHEPIKAADRNICEKQVLEEWQRLNRICPASGLPMTSPPRKSGKE